MEFEVWFVLSEGGWIIEEEFIVENYGGVNHRLRWWIFKCVIYKGSLTVTMEFGSRVVEGLIVKLFKRLKEDRVV